VVRTALPQQRRQQRWRKWRSPALLRSASTTQRPAFVTNICRGGLSPRRRGSASARSCCLDHVPARQQVAPCRRCRRPARRARLASRAGQALASHGKGATSTIGQPLASESPKGARPRATAPENAIARSSIRKRRSCQRYRPGVRWKREAFLLSLLRDRLTFVLRDGAATHAAADTPAPQRVLLPRALPKQQARPPRLKQLGSRLAFACEQRAARMHSCELTAAREPFKCACGQ
jgi:hypothetical protein